MIHYHEYKLSNPEISLKREAENVWMKHRMDVIPKDYGRKRNKKRK